MFPLDAEDVMDAMSRVMAACLRSERSRRRLRSWLAVDLAFPRVAPVCAAEVLGPLEAPLTELEVVDLVSGSDNEVVACCLVELHGGHREREHACGAVFELCREVVQEGDIESEQRGERLVDGNG